MFMTVLLTTYQMVNRTMMILHSLMTSLKYRTFYDVEDILVVFLFVCEFYQPFLAVQQLVTLLLVMHTNGHVVSHYIESVLFLSLLRLQVSC